MQHRINLACANVLHAIAPLPGRPKAVSIVAAAKEAGPVAGRERGGLVEKEQLGPAPPAHYLAPPAPEFADAGDPGRARPALFQQGLGRGAVDDAAIAGEHAAMRGGDDVACGRDAILQRHIGLKRIGLSYFAGDIKTRIFHRFQMRSTTTRFTASALAPSPGVR